MKILVVNIFYLIRKNKIKFIKKINHKHFSLISTKQFELKLQTSFIMFGLYLDIVLLNKNTFLTHWE